MSTIIIILKRKVEVVQRKLHFGFKEKFPLYCINVEHYKNLSYIKKKDEVFLLFNVMISVKYVFSRSTYFSVSFLYNLRNSIARSKTSSSHLAVGELGAGGGRGIKV